MAALVGRGDPCLGSDMRWRVILVSIFVLGCFVLWTEPGYGVSKPHVISFGKWMSVQFLRDSGVAESAEAIKIRALFVDGKIREYVMGIPHEVTDRLFVARRVFRVNDSMPEEATVHWQWQPGGWLMVDRLTGHISAVSLPEFDALYSAARWYRDYVAYCGVSDDGKKTFAMVVQMGRRKPVLKKQISGGLPEEGGADAICDAPTWQRGPVRVSFAPEQGEKMTFSIRGRAVDLVSEAGEDDEEK